MTTGRSISSLSNMADMFLGMLAAEAALPKATTPASKLTLHFAIHRPMLNPDLQ